ncbi:MAG: AbrB/MazE/SpoVT family DNA-binding domain-containing protein [Candidatus Competibacter sp.]
MATTRLSSKGQIVLPKSVRNAHHWAPGTEFEIENRPEGVLLRPKKRFATTHLHEVVGCTGYRGPIKSLEEMEEAIAKGVSEQHARGRY